MNRPPTHLTLMLLVDALRSDYLRHTSFLNSLAARSATGFLREGFGFVPRAAYFGGLDAGQYGFTNMYCHDPSASPFSLARGLPRMCDVELERTLGWRVEVDRAARERLPAFAKHYASSAEIPLEFLPAFDLVEKRAPWDRHVGYTALFAQLNERGLPWYQCSWPETNRLSDASDRGIVRQVLADLRPEHRFAFVHLQQLDGCGHVFGPNSQELQGQLATTDHLCRELIETLRSRYDQLNIVLFGDHGMVSVTRTVDAWAALGRTGLRFGSDYAFFLDSTMVRGWCYHNQARLVLEAALRQLPGGRLLTDADKHAYGIANCDPRNGEIIFLADPGVLIFPNFFQGGGEPIKGMHGYDPDCPDNLGFFLLHRSAEPGLPNHELGKVNPHQLYPLLKELIGLNDGPQASALAARPAESPGRYTAQADPAADAKVLAHMETIVTKVRQQVGSFEAIVLTGSFGRGEGGIFKNGDGAWHPVNDYDLFVVSSHDCSHELKALSEPLARELGLDYLDLGWTDGKWSQWPLTVANYDLKHGSQVIAGDPTVLDRLPAYASAGLPVYEAVKLLLNRTAGLLTGLRGGMFKGASLTVDQRRYLANQIAKAQMALGDSYLIRWAGYDASYRLRRERFAALASGAGVAVEAVQQVTQGYDFKFRPDYSIHADPLEAIRRLRPHLEAATIDTINRLGQGQARDLGSAMSLYLSAMSEDTGWTQDNAWFLGQPAFRALLVPAASAAVPLRHVVYSALPELLAAAFATDSTGELLEASRCRLALHFNLPTISTDHGAAWEAMRATTVAAWFAVHH